MSCAPMIMQQQQQQQQQLITTSTSSSTATSGALDKSSEKTGRWTKEEHDSFLHGLELFGKEWKKIADIIPTRSVVQIRTHAQKYFMKVAKGGRKGNSNNHHQHMSNLAASIDDYYGSDDTNATNSNSNIVATDSSSLQTKVSTSSRKSSSLSSSQKSASASAAQKTPLHSSFVTEELSSTSFSSLASTSSLQSASTTASSLPHNKQQITGVKRRAAAVVVANRNPTSPQECPSGKEEKDCDEDDESSSLIFSPPPSSTKKAKRSSSLSNMMKQDVESPDGIDIFDVDIPVCKTTTPSPSRNSAGTSGYAKNVTKLQTRMPSLKKGEVAFMNKFFDGDRCVDNSPTGVADVFLDNALSAFLLPKPDLNALLDMDSSSQEDIASKTMTPPSCFSPPQSMSPVHHHHNSMYHHHHHQTDFAKSLPATGSRSRSGSLDDDLLIELTSDEVLNNVSDWLNSSSSNPALSSACPSSPLPVHEASSNIDILSEWEIKTPE